MLFILMLNFLFVFCYFCFFISVRLFSFCFFFLILVVFVLVAGDGADERHRFPGGPQEQSPENPTGAWRLTFFFFFFFLFLDMICYLFPAVTPPGPALAALPATEALCNICFPTFFLAQYS